MRTGRWPSRFWTKRCRDQLLVDVVLFIIGRGARFQSACRATREWRVHFTLRASPVNRGASGIWGLDSDEQLEALVIQICYRAADLGFLLRARNERLHMYSDLLRREPGVLYGDEPDA